AEHEVFADGAPVSAPEADEQLVNAGLRPALDVDDHRDTADRAGTNRGHGRPNQAPGGCAEIPEDQGVVEDGIGEEHADRDIENDAPALQTAQEAAQNHE